jgi:hypothetical protein
VILAVLRQMPDAIHDVPARAEEARRREAHLPPFALGRPGSGNLDATARAENGRPDNQKVGGRAFPATASPVAHSLSTGLMRLYVARARSPIAEAP